MNETFNHNRRKQIFVQRVHNVNAQDLLQTMWGVKFAETPYYIINIYSVLFLY